MPEQKEARAVKLLNSIVELLTKLAILATVLFKLLRSS